MISPLEFRNIMVGNPSTLHCMLKFRPVVFCPFQIKGASLSASSLMLTKCLSNSAITGAALNVTASSCLQYPHQSVYMSTKTYFPLVVAFLKP